MRSTLAIEAALVTLAVALGASVTMVGCRGPLEAPLPAAHPDDATPRRGGTLHLATFGDVSSLDAAVSDGGFAYTIVRLLYAGLVDIDASGTVVPDLAEKVEEVDAGLTYRFTLRDGVRFQDGAPVTAAEVKRSIERSLHPTTPSGNAVFYGAIEGFADYTEKNAPHLAGVVVEGREVLAIHLHERDATFLQAMALPPLRITCPSAGDRYTTAWAPCGAGPFKLPPGGWERGRSITIVRNDEYFRPGLPYLDAVSWELGSTQLGEAFKFAHGDLDLILDLTQPETVRYQNDPRWQPFGAYDPPSREARGEAMNTEIPPLDNVEVRRAVAAAIDRDHIVLLRASNLSVTTKPVPDIPGYTPPPIGQRYDLAAALEHMRKAGYPFDPATGRGGWPAPIPYDVYRLGLAEATALSIQQDLAKIGIRLALRVSSIGTWNALTHRRGKSAMSPQGWLEDFPDPSDFLESRFAARSIADENGSNYSFYANPRVDALLDRAKREPDAAARTRSYAEVEQILCDDAPWAFEYSFRWYQVRQPYVRGYRMHTLWTNDIFPIWLDRALDTRAERDAPFSRELLGSLIGGRR